MDENVFNMSVRTFLKEVGVTSQREIERAVLQAVAKRRGLGEGKVRAKATIEIPDVGLVHVVDGEIALS